MAKEIKQTIKTLTGLCSQTTVVESSPNETKLKNLLELFHLFVLCHHFAVIDRKYPTKSGGVIGLRS